MVLKRLTCTAREYYRKLVYLVCIYDKHRNGTAKLLYKGRP